MKALAIFFFLSFAVNLQAQRFHRQRIDSIIAAQKDSELAHRLDSTLEHRYLHKNIDRRYIIRPTEKWTFKACLSSYGSGLRTEGNIMGLTENNIHLKSDVRADLKNTISASVSYRGITISAAMNPKKLFKRNDDFEINITSYGNRFGGDVIYQAASTFKGSVWSNGEKRDIVAGHIHQKMFSANGYYAFNYRRFSYPAAFSQSYIQQRSSGSWLLAASFQWTQTITDAEYNKTPINIAMQAVNFGIGGGYGYNFVLPHRWLIHISSLPTLMVINKNSQTYNKEQKHIPYRFSQTIITGRSAIVHDFHHQFAGMSIVYTYSGFGEKDNLMISNRKWTIRLFYGLRL